MLCTYQALGKCFVLFATLLKQAKLSVSLVLDSAHGHVRLAPQIMQEQPAKKEMP